MVGPAESTITPSVIPQPTSTPYQTSDAAGDISITIPLPRTH